jgi:cytochrome c-type protein NapB
MKPDGVESFLKSHHKLTLVLVAIFFMTAVSGYFMGVRATRNFSEENLDQREQQENEEGTRVGFSRAVSYAELQGAGLQPNAEWQNVIGSLSTGPVEPEGPVTALTDREKESVLEARQSRRQFDGAPPVVPHPITQRRAGACLLCHGDAGQPVIAGKMPPRMSHESYASCTQCHVPGGGPGDGVGQPGFGIEVMNAFQGQSRSGPGSRAYEGAPPTVPHQTLMRENCNSCHGPGRAHAIRTSHPERQSCNQCHASSAELNQRDFDLAGIASPVRFPVRLAPLEAPPETAIPDAKDVSRPVPGIKREPEPKSKRQSKGKAKPKPNDSDA